MFYVSGEPLPGKGGKSWTRKSSVSGHQLNPKNCEKVEPPGKLTV